MADQDISNSEEDTEGGEGGGTGGVDNAGGGVNNGRVLVEYKLADFRGFVFLLHDVYGLMLLRCTRKKNKPPHWQLPGGHIDEEEFLSSAEIRNDRKGQLRHAGKMGVARELFEETGIDVRSALHRVIPAALRSTAKYNKKGVKLLPNEYKSRLFYYLSVTDDDFSQHGVGAMGSDKEHWNKFRHVKLKLSVEHSGFTFELDPNRAAELLSLHSGGKVSEALKMAMKEEAGKLGSKNASIPTSSTKADAEKTEVSTTDEKNAKVQPASEKNVPDESETTIASRDVPFEIPPQRQRDKDCGCFNGCC